MAFIFVLVESIYATTKQGCGLNGTMDAIGIFQYLTDHGNRAASNRRADIEEMCAHLGVSLQPDRGKTPEQNYFVVEDSQNQEQAGPLTSAASSRQDMHSGPITQPQAPINLDWYEPFAQVFPEQIPYPMEDASMTEMSFGEGTHDIYSLYYNDDLALTGAVNTDWEELERQIVRH